MRHCNVPLSTWRKPFCHVVHRQKVHFWFHFFLMFAEPPAYLLWLGRFSNRNPRGTIDSKTIDSCLLQKVYRFGLRKRNQRETTVSERMMILNTLNIISENGETNCRALSKRVNEIVFPRCFSKLLIQHDTFA